MNGSQAALALKKERAFLQNILKDFKPEHATFRPTPEMMTVAQQINHIAFTAHWFREGAFGVGFDMDFEKIEAANHQDIGLEEAMNNLDQQYGDYIAFIEPLDESALQAPMKENPIFGALPKEVVLAAQCDHTAHHRGALSVYLRLLGVTPTMIYQE